MFEEKISISYNYDFGRLELECKEYGLNVVYENVLFHEIGEQMQDFLDRLSYQF